MAVKALPEDLEQLRALLRDVVRLPTEINSTDVQLDPSGPLELYTRQRDETNESELKKSAYVVEAMKSFERIPIDSPVVQGIRSIVVDLSAIFHPASQGYFPHWAQIFDVLLKHHPTQTYQALTTKPTLLHMMICYIHEGAVYDQLLNIIARAGKQGERRAEETLRRLADKRILHLLAERAATPGDPRAQPSADLLIAAIPELLQQAEGDRLLRSLDAEFFQILTKPLRNEAATREELLPVLAILRSLLYYSGRRLEEPRTSPDSQPRKLVNLLDPIRPIMRAALLDLLPGIARRLVHPQQQPQAPKAAQAKDSPSTAPAAGAAAGAPAEATKKPPATLVTFSAYKVREPFSSYRFALLGIIVEMTNKWRPEENVFDRLDVEFWRAVVAWFFDYPHNNMLHCMFFRLFSELVRANHEPSLRSLLSKGKFLSRMITAYNDKSIDSRGFILAMANMLRLQAATLPSSAFVADFLRSHEQWKTFLPLLLKESAIEHPLITHVRDHSITPQLSPVWRPLPTYNDKDGLELGSSFSKALGFGTEIFDEVIELGGRAPTESDDVPRKPTAKTPPQLRASPMRTPAVAPAAVAVLPSASAPPVAPPTAASAGGSNSNSGAAKKKKKKNKKAAASSSSSAEAAADGAKEP